MSDLVEQIDRLSEHLEGGQQTLQAWHLVPILKELAERLQELERSKSVQPVQAAYGPTP